MGAERGPNFSPRFLALLAKTLGLTQEAKHGIPRGLTPESIFHYIYGILHSPSFRSRYSEFLKIDFPRVPLTESSALFGALAQLGGELVALHLLRSDNLEKPIATFVGLANPEVEKVSHVQETVWLDKAQTRGFKGVPDAVWNFQIGGYQVCEKWLKDRKGRTLSKADIAHYQKIVVALSETIRLMQEIDAVVDRYGGWPGAFRSETDETQPPGPMTVIVSAT